MFKKNIIHYISKFLSVFLFILSVVSLCYMLWIGYYFEVNKIWFSNLSYGGLFLGLFLLLLITTDDLFMKKKLRNKVVETVTPRKTQMDDIYFSFFDSVLKDKVDLPAFKVLSVILAEKYTEGTPFTQDIISLYYANLELFKLNAKNGSLHQISDSSLKNVYSRYMKKRSKIINNLDLFFLVTIYFVNIHYFFINHKMTL